MPVLVFFLPGSRPNQPSEFLMLWHFAKYIWKLIIQKGLRKQMN
jgi:hypothetical protein